MGWPQPFSRLRVYLQAIDLGPIRSMIVELGSEVVQMEHNR